VDNLTIPINLTSLRIIQSTNSRVCELANHRVTVNWKAPSLSSPEAEEILLLLLLLLLLLYLRFSRPQRLRKRLRFYHLGHLWNMS